MKSVIDRNMAKGGTAYAENTGMDSLRERHKTLSKHIPGIRLEDMMHVIGGFYCPVSVLYGNPYVHTSNGGYAAKTVDGGQVYVSCPYCVFEKSLMMKSESLEEEKMISVVPGTEDSRHPWVVYTRENYQKIMMMETAAKTHTHPANNNKKKARS